MNYPKAVFSFITGEPRVELSSESRTILTHLQKRSPFGFMVTWPFCFHFWLMWREQLCTLDGWRPGTEQGLYFRTPGWRWDYELGMKWTWGYIGLHWD